MKKIIAIFMSIIIFALAFIGCSSEETLETKSDTIKLAVYPLTSPYFEYAIDEQNLFETYGANVELVEFAQYTDVIQALDSGSVDASIMGITEAVAPIVNNLGLEIVCMTDYSVGMDGIVASKEIKSVADLKGKTIATNIGTMNHMLLLSALDSVGLSEDDVTITNMSEGDATAALIGGSIDAASIFDPQMSKAAEESGGSIIFTSEDLPGELADVLLVKDTIADERADEVSGIIKAWYDIQKQYTSDSESVVKIISENTDLTNEDFYDLMKGLDIASLDFNKEIFADNGQKMVDLVSDVAEFLYNAECITEIPSKDDIRASINGKFIEELK